MSEHFEKLDIREHKQAEKLPFEVGSEFINDNEKVAVAEKKLEEFDEFFKSVPSTALPAIKLHLFNFFLTNSEASLSDIDQEFEKMKILEKKEKEAKGIRDVLPTIGIELEVPNISAPQNLRDVCSHINLRSGNDTNGIYEFRPDFSYDAAVQARMLHDIEKLIRLPEMKRESDMAEYAPVHVNLGVPKELKENEDLKKESDYLTRLVTLAFVSEERIGGGKWLPANDFHNLRREEMDKYAAVRLEIRTPSFENKSIYKMLFEIQTLSAAMFSFLKEQSRHRIKNMKKQVLLATLWDEFRTDFSEFSERHDLPKSVVLFSWTKQEKPEIEKEARDIFDRYAREAGQIISEK
ncbi:MAG: hypothetical protein WCF92_01385 [bacterium]